MATRSRNRTGDHGGSTTLHHVSENTNITTSNTTGVVVGRWKKQQHQQQQSSLLGGKIRTIMTPTTSPLLPPPPSPLKLGRYRLARHHRNCWYSYPTSMSSQTPSCCCCWWWCRKKGGIRMIILGMGILFMLFFSNRLTTLMMDYNNNKNNNNHDLDLGGDNDKTNLLRRTNVNMNINTHLNDEMVTLLPHPLSSSSSSSSLNNNINNNKEQQQQQQQQQIMSKPHKSNDDSMIGNKASSTIMNHHHHHVVGTADNGTDTNTNSATMTQHDGNNNNNHPTGIIMDNITAAAEATTMVETINTQIQQRLSSSSSSSAFPTTNTHITPTTTTTNTTTALMDDDDPPPFDYGTTRINDTHIVPIIPLRNDTIKLNAQECVRIAQGGVYIKHFRKAAGTSMYTFMESNVCPRGIPTYASELPFFMAEQTFHLFLGLDNNNKNNDDKKSNKEEEIIGTEEGNRDNVTTTTTTAPTTPSLNSSVVFVTSLRDPIERIISLYWYEGRWPRTCGKKCEKRKVKDNSTKVANLNEWIEHINNQENFKTLKFRRHGSCGQWTSVSDYYTRMLLGIDRVTSNERNNDGTTSMMKQTKYHRGFRNITLTRQHLHRAKEILASFDLILIVEHLQHRPELITMFKTITGGITTTNGHGHGSLHWSRHGKEKATSKYTKPSETDLKRLYELNAMDIELYQYAVDLSERTVERWTKQQEQLQQYEGTFTTETTIKQTDQCRKPPRILNEEQRFIAIGGESCGNGYRALYANGCLQHSREGSA